MPDMCNFKFVLSVWKLDMRVETLSAGQKTMVREILPDVIMHMDSVHSVRDDARFEICSAGPTPKRTLSKIYDTGHR